MKVTLDHLDKYREPHPVSGYTGQGDTVGCFKIPHYDYKQRDRHSLHFVVIASDGRESGWDHVSVHLRGYEDQISTRRPFMRTPSWDDMCWIKDQFFDHQETVIEFHPKRSEHINIHKHVLHLWKKLDHDHELPPSICV